MKRAAIYIRVSSDKQAQEGDSVPAQRDALHRYIKDHVGLIFAGEYLDDGVSGTKADRDELTRLLADVERGAVDLILVTKLDRLYRSIRHYLNMMETLDRCGVGWLAIWEPIYDTTTPQGRLIVNQMMSIAQFEAEQTGQRIRQVQAYKLTQREVISGSVPPGFRIEQKHLVPSEDADAVRLAFEIYARLGNLNRTMAELSGFHCFPRSKPAFKRMLTNPLYVGRHPSGIDGFCEPIIDAALFEDVQRKLKMNVKSSQKETYLFSGLLRCTDCGGTYGANTRRRDRGGGVKIIHQYRCAHHFNQRPALCPNAKVITEAALERQLLENLVNLTNDAIYKYETQQAPIRSREKQSAALRKKLTRLKELYLDGGMELAEYRQDRDAIEKQIEEIERHVGSVRGGSPAAPVEALRGLLAGNIGDIYARLTDEEKRRFWRGILDRIEVDKARTITVFFLGLPGTKL